MDAGKITDFLYGLYNKKYKHFGQIYSRIRHNMEECLNRVCPHTHTPKSSKSVTTEVCGLLLPPVVSLSK